MSGYEVSSTTRQALDRAMGRLVSARRVTHERDAREALHALIAAVADDAYLTGRAEAVEVAARHGAGADLLRNLGGPGESDYADLPIDQEASDLAGYVIRLPDEQAGA